MKKFYTDVSLADKKRGYAVLLDGKPVKTPLKALMLAPTQALAEAIVAEWTVQPQEIETASMPMTRLLYTAIDRAGRERVAVEAMIADYARSDLLCYRAEGEELAALQAAHWDRVLDWAEKTHGLKFTVTVGVMPVDQPAETIVRAARLLTPMSDGELAAFGQISHVLGSVLLAHALRAGEVDTDSAWAASRVDEDWQADKWGRDTEAEARNVKLRQELEDAARFHALVRQGGAGRA